MTLRSAARAAVFLLILLVALDTAAIGWCGPDIVPVGADAQMAASDESTPIEAEVPCLCCLHGATIVSFELSHSRFIVANRVTPFAFAADWLLQTKSRPPRS